MQDAHIVITLNASGILVFKGLLPSSRARHAGHDVEDREIRSKLKVIEDACVDHIRLYVPPRPPRPPSSQPLTPAVCSARQPD